MSCSVGANSVRPLTAKVITVSDRSFRGEREDLSGPAVKNLLERAGYAVGAVEVLPDEQPRIESALIHAADEEKLALIVTNHGEAVTERIDELCGRGTTIIDARGGFRKNHRDVVLCACSGKEMFTITREVKLLDPASFTIILESNEVHGEGFRMLRVAEPHAGDEK